MEDEAEATDIGDPIPLHFTHGKIYSWDSADVSKLRETHHIVGSLVGSLPRAPRQNLHHGLPLLLLPEEAAVLLEYGVAKMVKLKPLKVTTETITDFNDHRQQVLEEQKVAIISEREEKLKQMADVIDAGRAAKKRKLEDTEKSELQQEKPPQQQKQEQLQIEQRQGLQQTATEQSEDLPTDLSMKKIVTAEVVSNKPTYPQPQLSIHSIASDHKEVGALDLTMPKQESISGQDITYSSEETLKAESMQITSSDTEDIDKTKVKGSEGTVHLKSQITSVELMLTKGGIEGTADGVKLMETIQKCKESEEYVTESSIPTVCEDFTSSVSSYKEQSPDDLSSAASASRNSSEYSFEAQLKCDEKAEHSSHSNSTHGNGHEPLPPSVVGRSKDKKQDTMFNLQACMIQIPTVSPYSEYEEVTSWDFPSNDQERLRFRVFKYFWEKGYYLTTGGKFGGDFLVYPGDPFLFHSFYVVVCLPYTKRLNALDVVSYGRLASNVKKTVVLCSCDDNDDVVHTSIQWTGVN